VRELKKYVLFVPPAQYPKNCMFLITFQLRSTLDCITHLQISSQADNSSMCAAVANIDFIRVRLKNT
jgi:hypothetical protein